MLFWQPMRSYYPVFTMDIGGSQRQHCVLYRRGTGFRVRFSQDQANDKRGKWNPSTCSRSSQDESQYWIAQCRFPIGGFRWSKMPLDLWELTCCGSVDLYHLPIQCGLIPIKPSKPTPLDIKTSNALSSAIRSRKRSSFGWDTRTLSPSSMVSCSRNLTRPKTREEPISLRRLPIYEHSIRIEIHQQLITDSQWNNKWRDESQSVQVRLWTSGVKASDMSLGPRLVNSSLCQTWSLTRSFSHSVHALAVQHR